MKEEKGRPVRDADEQRYRALMRKYGTVGLTDLERLEFYELSVKVSDLKGGI